MKIEFFYLILGSFLFFVFIILLSWTIWIFREWRILEYTLEKFQDGEEIVNSSEDLQETRESKLISEIRQILNRASYQEKQAQKEKNQVMELISDLSHQLKTPLANIIVDIELLESNEMEDKQRQEFLCHVKAQASRMQWLMQSLLKASRLENGMIQFQAENINIKATIAKAVNAIYAMAAKKQIEIFMKEFQDTIIYHNSKWTAEAMANVLENAIKYSPKGSKIEIDLEKMDIYTRVTIHDEGPGIPKTEYNKIFQRFYRGKQTETEEGTGLGLYLAQLILQSEKGYLTVDSKLGCGSSFHFFLLSKK